MSTTLTDWMAKMSRHNSMVFCIALTLLLVIASEIVVTQSLGYFEPQLMRDYRLTVILAAGCTTALLSFPTLMILMKMTRRIDLMRQQLAQAVRTDYLTGTLSRSAFMETFERHQTRAKRQLENGEAPPCCDALLVVDADHFKKINDRFGHAVGDAVLTMMGRVLHTAVRPGDHVGRLGGEEFGVYLTGCDASAARFVAERLRLAVSEAADDLRILGLKVTVSVGAVVFEPSCDFARVFEKADAKLYDAKDAGRDKVVFDDPVPLAA